MARDVFDEVARLARDQWAIFRGEAMPYSNEAERLANGEQAKAAHERALASSLRIGATCRDFLAETMHYHGGSAHGLPLPLALSFNDPAKQLSAQECWAMLMHWRGDDAPWPGHAELRASERPTEAGQQASQSAKADLDQGLAPPNRGVNVPGYIAPNQAFRQLWELTHERFRHGDAAPWFEPEAFTVQQSHDPAFRVVGEKARERSELVFQRALLRGELVVFVLNGAQMEAVPPAAFVHRAIVNRLWSTETLGIDPLWPDHLQHWRNAVAYFRQSDFDHWLDGSTAFEAGDLPSMPPPVGSIPERISYRAPDRRDQITLCEAVTFLGLGLSLDRERLGEAVRWNGLCDGDLARAQNLIGDACERILDAAAQEGRLAATACHMEDRHASGVVRDSIKPMLLRSYRMLDISNDALWFGSGLRYSWQAPLSGVTQPSERCDFLQAVELDRRQFVEHFAPELKQSEYGDPLFIALAKDALPELDFDYAAPADIKAWWTETEALAWIVSRSAALVQEIGAIASENIGGGPKAPRLRALSSLLYWTARDFCQCAGQHHPVADERWEYCTCVRDAGRSLLTAINQATVRAYANGASLGVASFAGIGDAPSGQDWLDIQPAPLFSSAEVMANTPSLDQPPSQSRAAKTERAPSVKAGRPPDAEVILAKADEMKARGLDGRTIASRMRLEPGFQNVATTEVRELIKGRWTQTGRPKKKSA